MSLSTNLPLLILQQQFLIHEPWPWAGQLDPTPYNQQTPPDPITRAVKAQLHRKASLTDKETVSKGAAQATQEEEMTSPYYWAFKF